MTVPHAFDAKTWDRALDLALLVGDDDAVTALLATREAHVQLLEQLVPCRHCREPTHPDDPCVVCRRDPGRGWRQ